MLHNRLQLFRRSRGVTVFLLAVLTMSGTAKAAEPVNLSIASFKSGSGWYVLAQTMAQVIKQNLPPGSVVDVLPYSGGAGNPPCFIRRKPPWPWGIRT